MVSNMMLLAAAKPWTYLARPTLLIAQLLLLGDDSACGSTARSWCRPFAWMYDEEPSVIAEMLRARPPHSRRLRDANSSGGDTEGCVTSADAMSSSKKRVDCVTAGAFGGRIDSSRAAAAHERWSRQL
jgi:hypothetical protein